MGVSLLIKMKSQRKARQLKLVLPQWGGRRAGAGRKRKDGRVLPPGMPHLRRPELSARHPVHVTLKLRERLPSLRSPAGFAAVFSALQRGGLGHGFRLVHFAVLRDHVHLIVEARDRQALARSIQGLSVRIARGVNRFRGEQGRIFKDRYHARILETPREVRHAVRYVLENFALHEARVGRQAALGAQGSDPLSSRELPAWEPRTWLLRIGWSRPGRQARSQ